MTDETVARWRLYVQEILDKLDVSIKEVALYTGVSESTIRNWTNEYTSALPDLRMVSKFAIALNQPLRPALVAAGLPPEQLGMEGAPPRKTAEQLVLELSDIANQLAQKVADPENPSLAGRRGVMKLLLGTNPEFSPRQDRPPL